MTSKVAKASRKEGLKKCKRLRVQDKVLRSLGFLFFSTARTVSQRAGVTLNSARSRLTEAVGAGLVEESPERIKHAGHIACTGYRLTAKAKNYKVGK